MARWDQLVAVSVSTQVLPQPHQTISIFLIQKMAMASLKAIFATGGECSRFSEEKISSRSRDREALQLMFCCFCSPG